MDTVFGGLFAVNGLTVAVLPESQIVKDAPGGKAGLALSLSGAALVYFASAAYGFTNTSECLRFKKRVRQLDDDDDEGADQEELRRLRERVRALERNRD